MPDVVVKLHPDAVAEAAHARQWYAERDAAIGADFVAELDRGMAQVAVAPLRWPAYLRGTRRYLLR